MNHSCPYKQKHGLHEVASKGKDPPSSKPQPVSLEPTVKHKSRRESNNFETEREPGEPLGQHTLMQYCSTLSTEWDRKGGGDWPPPPLSVDSWPLFANTPRPGHARAPPPFCSLSIQHTISLSLAVQRQ